MSAGLALPPRGRPDPRTRDAVILLLDRGYLLPLRVLLHSLGEALRHRCCDVVVLTDDALVAADPVVTAHADRVVHLSAAEVAAATTAGAGRGGEARHAYTYLKLLAFGDLGYRSHLFLDCDMVCLDPAFRFEELLRSRADFAAAPTVGPRRLGLDGGGAGREHGRGASFSPRERRHAEAVLARKLDRGPRRIGSINSGVFLAGPRLLRPATVERLLDEARRNGFALEQQMLAAVLGATPGLRFEGLPLRYNVPVLPLHVMGEERWARVRDRVTFLHFNREKPWARPRAEADWLERVWWQALDDAGRPGEEPSLHRERRERLARAGAAARAWGALRRLGARLG